MILIIQRGPDELREAILMVVKKLSIVTSLVLLLWLEGSAGNADIYFKI